MTAIDSRPVDRLFADLAPFLARQTDGVPRPLLAALLRDALPELRTLRDELQRLVNLGREVESAVRAANPGPAVVR
jgi:hypothetical protein